MKGRFLGAVALAVIGGSVLPAIPASASIRSSTDSRAAVATVTATGAPGYRFTMSTRTKRPQAGTRIRFAVLLTHNHKPVPRALVRLKLALSPGKDARLAPKAHRTNARGLTVGILRLSRKVGRYVVVATWGHLSTRLRFVSAPYHPVGRNTSNSVLVWVAVAALGLLLLGVLVNIDVIRGALWGLTFGRLRGRFSGRVRSWLPQRFRRSRTVEPT